jgi:DNA-binding transcriptional LysR family regulator
MSPAAGRPRAGLELRQLEALVWIARLGGFHAAARRLGIAQPSLSARVKALEAALGVALLERAGRRPRLTPEGRELVDRAGRMLALLAEIERRVGARAALSGRVRLGLTGIAAVGLVPRLLERLDRSHPGVELELVVEASEVLRAHLLAGELDLALVAGPVHEPRLVSEPLGQVAMGWLAAPTLALPPGPLGPAELAELPLITDMRGSHLHGLARDWLARGGVEPRRQHACSSLPTRLRLAALGLGLALAPPSLAARELAEGRLRLVATDPPLPPLDYVVAVAGGPPGPAVQVVLELLRETVAADPGFHIRPPAARSIDRI